MTDEPHDRQDHWNAVYRRNAADAVSWFEAEPALSLAMIGDCGLGLDARIVDIGGGASGLPAGLLARGFRDVTVLDIAQAALDIARARMGDDADKMRWIEADITTWRPGRTYDLWHDRAVLHFLTDAADRARYAATVGAALAPGGHAIIASFAPDGPERCSGLPVMRSAPEDIAALLGPGFAPRASRNHEHHTPGGTVQRFSYVRLQKS